MSGRLKTYSLIFIRDLWIIKNRWKWYVYPRLTQNIPSKSIRNKNNAKKTTPQMG